MVPIMCRIPRRRLAWFGEDPVISVEEFPPAGDRLLILRAAVPALLLGLAPQAIAAQRPLAPNSPTGQSVTPVFEGWYKNADGTFSLSFGYLNRNVTERMNVPIGDSNFVSPGALSRGQPTHFAPRRHWGVFAVVVPADFGDKKVTWTLKNRGQTFAVPGHLREEWQIDALEGEASADNTPPALRFTADGPVGRGPLGVTVGPMTTSVGKPLALTVQVTDDAKTGATNAQGVRVGTPVDITWFKHQGAGDITFSATTARLSATGGNATTTATFSRAGDYMIRVRANDSAVASAGHSQCCWSNAFVKVTVTP